MKRESVVAVLLSLGLLAVIVAIGVIASGCELEGEARAGTLDGREDRAAAVSAESPTAEQDAEYAQGKCGHWEDEAAYGEVGCGGGCGGDDYAKGDPHHAGCPYLKAAHEAHGSGGGCGGGDETDQSI